MFCPQCGKNIPYGVKFCPECGKSTNITNVAKPTTQEDKLYCPHCGSSQLTANKKGYGAGKAAAGVLLTGGVGLLAGFIGSGKIKITCLKCGKVMEPGELRTTPLPPKSKVPEQELSFGCILAIVIIIGSFIVFCAIKCS